MEPSLYSRANIFIYLIKPIEYATARLNSDGFWELGGDDESLLMFLGYAIYH